MGCGASRSTEITQSNPEYIHIDKAWDRAWATCDVPRNKKSKAKKLIIKRSGWKTVRIFVSSTFRDFHQERNELVKKVFPDLRAWCEKLRLHLVECDLRWGVPMDFTTELTLRACLGEIDRCYQDNVMPFFLNMTSERIGWIPGGEEVPPGVKEEYAWVEGLSVTEMEIMHGAYRKDNPNSLFLMRDSAFLQSVPEEYRTAFIDNQDVAPYKLQMLKKMINERFQKGRAFYYKPEYVGLNPDTKEVELGGFSKGFSDKVFEFFKKRIAEQYPMPEANSDPYHQMAEQHESFMKSRGDAVFGRDDILKQIDEYICGVSIDVPLLVVAEAGTGKSSIMAKAADSICAKALNHSIPGGGKNGWHVFYHFVGAVPGSTELEEMLKRLLKEIGVCDDSNLPSSLEKAGQLTCSVLSNPNTKPLILLVDALNQFDDDDAASLVSWVPRKLGPNVRCVFSFIPETPQHKSFLGREPLPKILNVAPLDHESRQLIVTEMLGKYNKKLDASQMESLLSKESSENPLWLSIACEELRVFGKFREVAEKVNQLADGLLQLEIQVLERFEKESGGELLQATLCLLEVSSTGLLEVELLNILGDEDNLMPGSADDKENVGKKSKDVGALPAYKWAEVYRALRPFLRPFGDSGEGRLDFYHRSLSKAVRMRYFKDDEGNEDTSVYTWWHTKLADFFQGCTNLERKMEEYPSHVIYIKDKERLAELLTDWEVFDLLYDIEYSSKLVKYWREGSSFEFMEESYDEAMNNLKNSGKLNPDQLSRRYESLSRFLGQAGRFAKGEELLKCALKIEEEELGSRDERMVELHHLTATIADEVMKMEEYMYRSQLPRMRHIIETFEKSVAIRRTLPGDHHKSVLGMTLNRLAFYYSGYNLRGGDSWMSGAEALEKGTKSVDEAIEIFKELKDETHVGDSLTTKGVVIGRATPEQIKVYLEAQEILLRLGGELHHNLDRLYLNIAIYYEECGDYNLAYDNFYKWYKLCVELYGTEHPRATRCFNTLREPMYRRVAQEKGNAVP